MIRRLGKPVALLAVAATIAACAAPPPAAALDLTKPICTLAGLVNTLAGKLCSTARHPGRLLSAGKKLLGGHLGGALSALSGSGTAARALTAGAALAAVVGWVTGGTKFALQKTAAVIASTTRPELQSSWFSASYWRMAAISALLTLPFMFAAAIQALMRSDTAMLARSALGYLPLGLLAVSIAAPVTMLLLAASDELSAIVSSASGGASVSFLARASVWAPVLDTISGSTFLEFFVGLLTVAAAVTLWVELLIRSAAVYVIVLMLPLFFAALVWPARRVWAVRAVEILVALILSKFVIVAVLSLGGAALGHALVPSFTRTLEGTTLLVLAAFSPWALLRLLPLHELASGLDGLRSHAARPLGLMPGHDAGATEGERAEVDDLPAGWVRRVSFASGRSEAARTAVQRLAREGRGVTGVGADDGGVTGSGADDGATNGATVGQGAAGAGPEAAPSPPVPAGAMAAHADGSTAGPPDPISAALASAPPDSRPRMDPRLRADNWTRPTTIGLEGLPALPPPDPSPGVQPPPSPGQLPDVADEHTPRPPSQEPDGGLL